MSTTPKGPKPEEPGSSSRPPPSGLDQTFLGVAPQLPVPASSPAPPVPASSPALPMPASSPALLVPASSPALLVPASSPALPAAPGGSAIIAAPMISVSGDRARGANPVPAPPVVTSAPTAPPRAPLPGGWQSATVMPRPPGSPELQGTATVTGAARAPAANPPAALQLPRPIPPAVERSQPAYPAGAEQHTALASDYLRGARDAAFGAAPATPSLSSDRAVPTPTVSVYPGSSEAHERSSASSGSSAAFQRTAPISNNPEALHGPSSTGGGTQASVAPPPLDAPTPAWSAPPTAGWMAPMPNAPRAAAPSPLAGTVLEPLRNLPTPGVAAPNALASSGARFEPVPSARGAFSLQGPGAPLSIPIDQSATDWAPTGGNAATGGAKNSASSSPLRLILLAAVAVLAIGLAIFGKRLLGGAPAQRSAQSPAQPRPLDIAGSPDQALLANRPLVGVGTPSSAPALGAATNPAEPPVAAETMEKAAVSPDGVPSGVNSQAEAAASPESRLAAQGARHVIAGRYAEALPVYRELARAYSQNTAYTAMAHVLEQKLGLAPGAAPTAAKP